MKTNNLVYANNWNLTKRKVYQGTRKCCSCLLCDARYIHHLKYTRSPLRRFLGLFLGHSLKKSNAGLEVPGWDVVPVCEVCHEQDYGKSNNYKSVHFTGQPRPKWLKIYSNDITVVLNRNSDWMMFRLRFAYFFLSSSYLFLALAIFIAIGLFKLLG